MEKMNKYGQGLHWCAHCWKWRRENELKDQLYCQECGYKVRMSQKKSEAKAKLRGYLGLYSEVRADAILAKK